jgi:hypothetical protein
MTIVKSRVVVAVLEHADAGCAIGRFARNDEALRGELLGHGSLPDRFAPSHRAARVVPSRRTLYSQWSQGLPLGKMGSCVDDNAPMTAAVRCPEDCLYAQYPMIDPCAVPRRGLAPGGHGEGCSLRESWDANAQAWIRWARSHGECRLAATGSTAARAARSRARVWCSLVPGRAALRAGGSAARSAGRRSRAGRGDRLPA